MKNLFYILSLFVLLITINTYSIESCLLRDPFVKKTLIGTAIFGIGCQIAAIGMYKKSEPHCISERFVPYDERYEFIAAVLNYLSVHSFVLLLVLSMPIAGEISWKLFRKI